MTFPKTTLVDSGVHLPAVHAITLPFEAHWPWQRGRSYNDDHGNAYFFEGRHTLFFGGVGEIQVEPWLQIVGHEGLLFPPMTGNDDIQRESGIFQRGSDVVALKPPSRIFRLHALLLANERGQFDDARQRLSGLFSPDLATARRTNYQYFAGGNAYFATSSERASMFDAPFPWTYTYIGTDGSPRHIDFYVRSITGGIGGEEDGMVASVTIECLAPDPRLYGPEISVDLSGNGTPIDPLTSPYDDLPGTSCGSVLYNTGTARTGYRIYMSFDDGKGYADPPFISAFGLEDEYGLLAIFKNADYPDAHVAWEFGIDSAGRHLVFDTEKREAYIRAIPTGLFTWHLYDLDQYALVTADFAKMQLVPGVTHDFFFHVNDAVATPAITATLTYRPRFWGI